MMSDLKKKFSPPARYGHNAKSVWNEYVELASVYKPAINMGNGFPDFLPPKYVTDALLEVAKNPNNLIHQYTRGHGHPRLIAALSKLYSQLVGRDINPEREIVTSLGGYHALFLAIMGHVDVGDEVILMEPFFDCYELNVKSAGGIPKCIPFKLEKNVEPDVPITSANWVLDRKQLENLFNSKTKAIIINTPHNPLGKVFTYDELNHIANLCKKWNVLCISDEVYEWLVYDSQTHIRMATLPDMWERTLTVGSAGKMFGVTGWKLGWVYGPDDLIDNLKIVHQDCVRAGNTILQEAVAICLEKELSRFGQEDSYFITLPKKLEQKRNFMYKILTETGMKPILTHGGYFMVADWSPLEKAVDLSDEKDEFKDYCFTKWMTKNVGIMGIPISAFYTDQDKKLGENFVRYCFVKTDDCLKKAAQIFENWKAQLK